MAITAAASRRYQGFSLIYTIVVMSTLCAFCSLAVDLGRVQLAKTELQAATDAAARYAVMGVNNGTAASKAIAAAADNKVDGSSVVVSASDVISGNWDTTQTPNFSTTRLPANAVQVTASRTGSSGIPLLFGKVIGASNCNVHATAIAKAAPIPMGFVGLQGITVKNNLVSKTYNTSVNTSPAVSSRPNSGMLASNGTISAGMNETAGLVVLGPSGSTDLTTSSPPKVLPSTIDIAAPDFSGAPTSNPNGVSTNLIVNGNTTLAGGTYYFTSITMKNNSNLTFSGPATLYIDGSVTFTQNGAITAYNDIPGNLIIYERGVGTTFGGNTANNVDVTAFITAPQTQFIAWNGASLKGAGIFLTITAKNDSTFYYDETLNLTLPGQPLSVVLVK